MNVEKASTVMLSCEKKCNGKTCVNLLIRKIESSTHNTCDVRLKKRPFIIIIVMISSQ